MKIGILGVGNMGGAILKGLINRVDPNDIYALNPINPRVDNLQTQLRFHLLHQTKELIPLSLDVIIATVPAHINIDVLSQLRGISNQTIIISAAGGITIEQVKSALPNNPVAAIIPNTPVAINHGTIATAFESGVDEHTQQVVTECLKLLGDVIVTKESNLGISGTIGGCGPAFVDLFMDAMADAAVAEGLDRASAYQIIASMVAGSGQLAFQTGQTPATLKDQVTSPGGTTIKGVNALDANGFRNAVIQAVKSANQTM